MRDGGAVPQHPHKVKIAGSNPAPATIKAASAILQTSIFYLWLDTAVQYCTISVAVTSLPSKQMSSVRSRYRAPINGNRSFELQWRIRNTSSQDEILVLKEDIYAGIVQWQYMCLPSIQHGFESRYLLQPQTRQQSLNRRNNSNLLQTTLRQALGSIRVQLISLLRLGFKTHNCVAQHTASSQQCVIFIQWRNRQTLISLRKIRT